MKKIEKTIKIDAIKFKNDSEISVKLIDKFLEMVENFEDTIDVEDNWSDEYFYFSTKEDKELESVLLDLDVIRRMPNSSSYSLVKGHDTSYWLSKGYSDFLDEYYNVKY